MSMMVIKDLCSGAGPELLSRTVFPPGSPQATRFVRWQRGQAPPFTSRKDLRWWRESRKRTLRSRARALTAAIPMSGARDSWECR